MKTLASFILIFLALQTNAIIQPDDESLIQTTCKNTPNYQLCIATLTKDPTSRGADVAGLALIMVTAVESKSKQALVEINNLKKSGQPKLLPALKDCTDKYKAVIEGDVPTARSATRGDPKFAETAMADASIEAELCEESLEGVVSPSPLKAINQAVSDLGVVARAIIRNLL